MTSYITVSDKMNIEQAVLRDIRKGWSPKDIPIEADWGSVE
jgi:hypothetical protein